MKRNGTDIEYPPPLETPGRFHFTAQFTNPDWTNATRYNAYYSSNNVNWTFYNDDTPTAQNDLEFRVPIGVWLYVRVGAQNADGESFSDPLYLFTAAYPQVIGHTAHDGSAATVATIEFVDNSSTNATDGFLIERSTNNFTSIEWSAFLWKTNGATTCDSSNFAANTTYKYRCSVTNTSLAGQSDYSDTNTIAPRSVPTTPLTLRVTPDPTGTNATIYWTDTDRFNVASGYRVDWWTNGGSITAVGAKSWSQFPSLTASGLVRGLTNFFEVVATNLIGQSVALTNRYVVPNQSPGNVHVWYVDPLATGAVDGSSWSNAWSSLNGIGWDALHPGDIVFISGGTNEQYYSDWSMASGGASNAPVTFLVGTNAGHSGVVRIRGQVNLASWVTLNGGKNPNLSWPGVVSEDISTNINLDISNPNDSCVVGQNVNGAKVLWADIHDAGSVNQGVIPKPSTADLDGVSLYCATQSFGNSIGYCLVRSNWTKGVAGGISSSPTGWGGVEFHHLVLDHQGDDSWNIVNSVDIHHCLLKPGIGTGLGTKHADGIEGYGNYTRIYNNVFFSDEQSSGVTCSFIVTNGAHWYLYGNVFTYSNVGPSSSYCNLASQDIAGSGFTNSWLSDLLVANNTFYVDGGGFSTLAIDSTNVHWNGVLYANNVVVASPDTASGPMLTMAPGAPTAVYDSTNVQWIDNSVGGKFFSVSFNGTIYDTVSTLQSSVGNWFGNNTNLPPVSSLVVNGDYRLTASMTGTNLSAWTNAVGLDADIDGHPRGVVWDRGAYAYYVADTNLILWLTFSVPWTDRVPDQSGYGNDLMMPTYGADELVNVPGSVITNIPTWAAGPSGMGAAQFLGHADGYGKYGRGGDFAWIRDNQFRNLTNMTLAAWFKGDDMGVWNAFPHGTILGAGDNGGQVGCWRFGRYYGDNTEFYVWNGSDWDEAIQFPDHQSTGDTTNWNHYAVVCSNGAAYSYWNGALNSGPVNLPTNVLTSSSDYGWVSVSCWAFDSNGNTNFVWTTNDVNPNTGWLNGKLTDLRVYNRTLSAAEVQAIYLRGVESQPAVVARPVSPRVRQMMF